MLFHITHIHTYDVCPYHHPEKAKATFGQMVAKIDELAIKAHGVWVDPPAHTLYMLIEADGVDQVEELLAPIIDIGHAETRVVSDAREVLKRRVSEA